MLTNFMAPSRRLGRTFDREFDDTIRDFFGNMNEDLMMMPLGTRAGKIEDVSIYVPIDFIEKPKEYQLRAELSGVKKENIVVNIEPNNLLSISGNKEKDYTLDEEDFFRRNERSIGRFHRRIRLPLNADYDKANCEYCNGILCMTIPKKSEAEQEGVKKLEIK